MKSIQERIIDEFESDLTQQEYTQLARTGLWGGEEILVDRYFKKGGRILDVGCGTGRTTLPLHDRGFEIAGIDITPRMIENAKRIAAEDQKNIEYRVMDAGHLEFRDNSFDGVLFSNQGWDQIPSKEKRAQALAEIFRVPKPGGTYLFSTHIRTWKFMTFFWMGQWIRYFALKPFGLGVWENDYGDRMFRREINGKEINQFQFIHIPSLSEIKKALSNAGFKTMEMERHNALAPKKPHPSNALMVVCQKPA
jgi:ubiquinone/menaquinone biosynthesis C-methylase UbiE